MQAGCLPSRQSYDEFALREVLASFAEMRRVVKRPAAMRGDAADVISADGPLVSVPVDAYRQTSANSASALRLADVDLRRPYVSVDSPISSPISHSVSTVYNTETGRRSHLMESNTQETE